MKSLCQNPNKRWPFCAIATTVFSGIRFRLLIVSACVWATACAPLPPRQTPLPIATATPQPYQPQHQPGSIYQPQTSRLLFEDSKARRTGDLITVILEEETVASKSASTSSSKDTSIELPAPTLLGTELTSNGRPLSTGLSTGNTFSGAGDSNQSNRLTGNITVTVTGVTHDGNLIIAGEKQLTLNTGRETISISGIIRPIDVSPLNTIASTLIADARISYSGNGAIADSNRAGWLSRLVNSRVWPF